MYKKTDNVLTPIYVGIPNVDVNDEILDRALKDISSYDVKINYDSNNITEDGLDFLEFQAKEDIMNLIREDYNNNWEEINFLTQRDIDEYLSVVSNNYEQNYSNIRYNDLEK